MFVVLSYRLVGFRLSFNIFYVLSKLAWLFSEFAEDIDK